MRVMSIGGYTLSFEDVITLGAIVGALMVCWQGIRSLVDFVMKPQRKLEEGDRVLHERVDKLEKKKIQCDKKFADDFDSIKQIRRQLNRIEAILELCCDAVQLLLQHAITGNHTDELKKCMRDFSHLAFTKDESELLEHK